ncbi:hypothetical protein HPB47_019694 [Ixodes persulcatus]|uniref:Uncharacterized protein n=1 Tax=Ixodes persulcatus TaxID=34615 RepID=A0AC60QIC9_IXOPE|nr:hypothetical protein HPB47_019694 [Ixodes persulcatus]
MHRVQKTDAAAIYVVGKLCDVPASLCSGQAPPPDKPVDATPNKHSPGKKIRSPLLRQTRKRSCRSNRNPSKSKQVSLSPCGGATSCRVSSPGQWVMDEEEQRWQDGGLRSRCAERIAFAATLLEASGSALLVIRDASRVPAPR